MLIFDDLGKIVSVLQGGGIIIYPSDTAWNMGCDALNEQAIAKLCDIKEVDLDKSLVLLVSDLDMLKLYAGNIHPRIESLLFYHEKPVTVIFKDVPGFPPVVYGDKKTIGIRVVRDRYCQEFIREFGKPVIAASIRIKEVNSPGLFRNIPPELVRQADYVSLYRRNDPGVLRSAATISFNAQGKLKFLD